MYRRWVVLWNCVVIAFGAVGEGELPGRIVSAGLFKNGVTVVTREYTLPGPGRHAVTPMESAIHGTLWIESDASVIARLESTTVERSIPHTSPDSMLEKLRGKPVRLYLREGNGEPLEGTLLNGPANPGFDGHRSSGIPSMDSFSMYVLALSDGRQRFVAVDTVVGVESLAAVDTGALVETVEAEVLVFDVVDGVGPVKVRATYLARGLSWAPSYRVEMGGVAVLTIAQSAAIRNELGDIDGAELTLISGYPSVEFDQVTTPFAPGARWSNFFSQLTQRNTLSGSVISQMSISNNLDLVEPMANGVGAVQLPDANLDIADIYYHAVGSHVLKRGDAMFMEVASAEAPYERVVEWNVPDSIVSGSSQQADMWDAVRFTNPFGFPMTTGPAMVMEDGQFLGSRTSKWVNPGEETLIHVGKSLSVSVGATETEVSRVATRHLSREYWESTLTGELQIRNRRAEPVEMIVRKQLEGRLIDADAEPETSVGKDGPGQLNSSVGLTWRLTVAPGETRSVKYRYTYLDR